MPLEYELSHKDWDALLPVLEEHSQWFYNLLTYFFYAGNEDAVLVGDKPKSFSEWVSRANQSDTIQPEIVEKLTALHDDLFKMSDILVDFVRDNETKPPYKEFREFVTLHDEFSSYIRRLAKDFLVEISGFDSFTGLRSRNMLNLDVGREMERLSRQGRSFCIALVRVDHFDDISQLSSRQQVVDNIKLISSLIKISIRSFDDAYYLGEGEFALCLKQADISGGISALERLRKELESKDIMVPDGKEKSKRLSMSCCIAEPIEGDNVSLLLSNLKEDLAGSNIENADTVLKYRELSPLQRYVQEEMV